MICNRVRGTPLAISTDEGGIIDVLCCFKGAAVACLRALATLRRKGVNFSWPPFYLRRPSQHSNLQNSALSQILAYQIQCPIHLISQLNRHARLSFLRAKRRDGRGRSSEILENPLGHSRYVHMPIYPLMLLLLTFQESHEAFLHEGVASFWN